MFKNVRKYKNYLILYKYEAIIKNYKFSKNISNINLLIQVLKKLLSSTNYIFELLNKTHYI
jgi:hypothetical protein